MLTNTKQSPYSKVSPLAWNSVNWTEGLWAQCQHVCEEKTVPHLQSMFESKEISHVVENFKICAGEVQGNHDGTPFGDGDFYKWMEAAMYTAAQSQNEAMFQVLDEYIGLIGRAQQEDGYISTKQIIAEMNQNTNARLGDINEFEIYNFGHLFTASCLYYRITGKDNFLQVAKKAANYLEQLYREAAKTGNTQTAVCPSHYMGLIELYRTTGEKLYLELAQLAVELRDAVKDGLDDNQDRIPLKQHEKIIGHAVRANYLYAGVADLYTENGDEEYLAMLHKVWRNLVDEKIYITGGCGALYNGTSPYGNFFIDQKIHQAYGYEYQLPNVTAYNETCASIGSVMWAYRMFQIEPKAEYFDLIEKTMLNVNLAAISLDGQKYFYQNALRRAKKLPYELIWPLERSEYILSYCCPPNLARTIAQASEYVYTISQDSIWTGLYGANKAAICLDNGAEFTLVQTTEYPYDGRIRFTSEAVIKDVAIQLHIRIPEWVESGCIQYNGTQIVLQEQHSSSYITIEITTLSDMELVVQFDMPTRLITAHGLVEENTNQVAVERGPLVYCMETPDVLVDTLDDVYLDCFASFVPKAIQIADRQVVALEGTGYVIRRENYQRNRLYQKMRYKGMKEIPVQMIPYFAWDNRGYGEMKIWIPVIYSRTQ